MAEFQFQPIPFHQMLSGLGNTVAGSIRQNRLKNSLSDFQGDYTKAAEELMRMGYVDEATKLYTSGELAKYRDIQGQVALGNSQPSVEDQILQQYLQQQNQQPSYLGPPELNSADAREEAEAAGMAPSPVPGINIAQNLDNAPSIVQDQLGTTQQKAKWKQLGEGEGNRESSARAMRDLGPSVQSIINQALSDAATTDPNTFANALGPLQGADDPNTWQEAIGTRGAQSFGSLLNYLQHTQGQGLEGLTKPVDKIPGGLTSTVRDNVKALQATLINQVRKVQRVVGEGSQSDRELQQIIDQVGKLQNSRTLDDYRERIAALAKRLNDVGIPVQMPSPEEISGLPPTSKSAERYANPGEAPGPVARSVPTYNVDPVTGSMAPTGNDPYAGMRNRPPKQAAPAQIKGLERELSKYKPGSPEANRIIEEFDRLIGAPGSAEFYLLRSR
jgi:hypothetical protein